MTTRREFLKRAGGGLAAKDGRARPLAAEPHGARPLLRRGPGGGRAAQARRDGVERGGLAAQPQRLGLGVDGAGLETLAVGDDHDREGAGNAKRLDRLAGAARRSGAPGAGPLVADADRRPPVGDDALVLLQRARRRHRGG